MPETLRERIERELRLAQMGGLTPDETAGAVMDAIAAHVASLETVAWDCRKHGIYLTQGSLTDHQRTGSGCVRRNTCRLVRAEEVTR